MDAADRALDRLRDPSGDALRALARIVVDEAMATPIRDIARPRWIAGQIATALEAATHGDHVRRFVDKRLEEGRERWRHEARTPRSLVPKEAEAPLRTLLGRPWTPDQQLTFRMLDQPAMRNLVREVLEETLIRFQRRLRALDKGVGGLGSKVVKRGRGLLGNVAGNLGGLAENVVGAVAEELEHAIQDRVREFVASATGEAIRSIARHLADPQYAGAFGELRIAVLDVILDTPISKLAEEADKLRPEELVDVVLGAVRSAVAAEDFVDVTEQRVAKLLEQAGDGTLGAWLDEVGLRDVWNDTTVELLTERLKAVVGTTSFELWWRGLFAPSAGDAG